MLQRRPALGEFGGGVFAEGTDRAEELVVGAVVDVERLVGDPGPFLDWGVDADSGAVVAGVGEGGKPGGRGFVQGGQGMAAGGGDVVDRARLNLGDPQWGAVRGGQELDVAAEGVVFTGVPQVGAGGAGAGDPVTGDQGAVEDHVAEPLVVAAAQHLVQVRSPSREHVDALVQIPVAGGLADAGVAGQAVHAASVAKPAQHQHRLTETTQRTAAPRGAKLAAVSGQQPGQVLHHRAWDIECGSIGNQREASGYRGHDLVVRPVLPEASRLPITGSPSTTPAVTVPAPPPQQIH